MKKFPAVDHKKHMRDVVPKPHLKRPAAATPVLLATPPFNRPAAAKPGGAALAESPSPPEDLAHPLEDVAHPLDEITAVAKQSIDYIEKVADPSKRGVRDHVAETKGKMAVGMQKGVYVALVRAKAADGKMATMATITDKQLGSKEKALKACNILLRLWDLGSTKSQLQLIKNSGLLGVSCGAPAKWE